MAQEIEQSMRLAGLGAEMDIGDGQGAVTPGRGGVVVSIVVAHLQHDAPRLTVLLLRGCDRRLVGFLTARLAAPSPLVIAGLVPAIQ